MGSYRSTWSWRQNPPSYYDKCSLSQNHRMVGVGRDLCGSSSPTPLPKQGHLQQAAEDLLQAGLEYLQRRRLHHLPGQPVPVLCHPQREKVLPHVQMELPVLQFVFKTQLDKALSNQVWIRQLCPKVTAQINTNCVGKTMSNTVRYLYLRNSSFHKGIKPFWFLIFCKIHVYGKLSLVFSFRT